MKICYSCTYEEIKLHGGVRSALQMFDMIDERKRRQWIAVEKNTVHVDVRR